MSGANRQHSLEFDPAYLPVPEEWEVVKGKWIFEELKRTGYSDLRLLSVTQHQGVVPRDESDINVWNPSEDVSHYKLVEPGNFVISLRSFEGGIEYSNIRGIVSPAYVVMKAVERLDEWHNYMRFLFKSRPFVDALHAVSSGIRQGKTISFSEFGELPIPLPPRATAVEIGYQMRREAKLLEKLNDRVERLNNEFAEKRAAFFTQWPVDRVEGDE